MQVPQQSPSLNVNKIIEKQMEADKAYKLAVGLVMTYDATFQDPHPGQMNDVFEFMEPGPFATWYKANYLASAQVGNTEALTIYSPKKIGVNLEYHTFGSLVHESFHFLSHPDFRKAVMPSQNEGFTELLTRLAMDLKGPRSDVKGRGDFYGQELTTARKYIDLDMGPRDLQTLIKAYVSGDSLGIRQIQLLIKMVTI